MGGDTTSKAARATYEMTVKEVRQRVLEGQTNTQIAEAIGKSRDAVATIRRKRLGKGRRHLRLTDDEREALDQHIIAGGSTRAIARDFAIASTTVARRKQILRDQVRTDLRPCRCGKDAGHLGRCDLVVDPADIRRRLLDGQTTAEIAREYNRTAQNFKPKYVAPVIAELTAEGRMCRCGAPFGHNPGCWYTANRHRMPGFRAPVTPTSLATKRRKGAGEAKLSADQLSMIKRRHRDRASIRSISRRTEIPYSVVQRVVRRLQSKSYGRTPCMCGRAAGHPGGCVKNTPRALNKRWAQRIESMILEGQTIRDVMDELRLSHEAVFKYALPARQKLLEAGIRCACGREIGHRYWCSATWDRFEMPRGHIPLEPQLDRAIKKALIAGEPVQAIAKEVRIGTPTIFRIRREMSLADRQVRRRVMRQRFAMTDEVYSRSVLEQISRVVRAPAIDRKGEQGGADHARTLEDIRNDLYLAVMEGRIDVDEIALAVKRMLRRDWWDRKTAPPSADEALGEDGGSSRSDFLEDDTFLRSLDQMPIGHPLPSRASA